MRTIVLSCFVASAALAQGELQVPLVKADLSKADPAAAVWKSAPAPLAVPLMAQPMVTPRPEATTTSEVKVQAVHDGTRVAFRLAWKDDGVDEAGVLGTFSDAAAIQFPLKASDTPPPVMMGAKDQPVHIFHWRAQYQRDAEKGKPTPKDLYPNLNVDMYPMEFHDMGAIGDKPQDNRDQYSPGRATGNPQAFSKTGVDEIIAEGFSTSSVQEGHGGLGKATWANGEWSLVISRPLKSEGGSVLTPGGKSFIAFAVWQGGKKEVGSRKSLTMAWTTLSLGK
ncbi:MAG: ethylbenzene dehydrogenase-related protein [Myxococcota bacterium]